jgi:quercetin dioxygenase-like cupin family protein
MKLNPFIVNRQDYAHPLNVVGVDVTVLASNEKTNSYEVTLQEGPEGTGPMRHTHPWDESFYVLRGTVNIDSDGEIIAAEQGALVHFPAGTPHGYRFGAGGGAMLEIAGAGGAATKMFAQIAAVKVSGPSDLPRVLPVFEQSGVTVCP